MDILYKNIKDRRTSLGMSQEELAMKSGYGDRTSIAKIEAGKVDLTQSRIKMLAEALQTTPAYLMGWEDSSPFKDEETEIEIHTIAAHALDDLTEEEQLKLIEFAKFIKSQRTPDGK